MTAALRCFNVAISCDWNSCCNSILAARVCVSISCADVSAGGSGVSWIDVRRDAVRGYELVAARIIDSLLLVSSEVGTSDGGRLWNRSGWRASGLVSFLVDPRADS